jgi:tetratricopeptide (TPR) repeat protein
MAIGKQALARSDYKTAQTFFATYLHDNPDSTEALLLAGNAAMGLNQHDEAARDYQNAIAKQPTLWPAHKNLVIIYAISGRWPEFDQQRKLIQDARTKGASGLSPQDSDVIDILDIGSERYITHANATLTGRYKTRYFFTHFNKDDKLDLWITCESDDTDQVLFATDHPKEAAAGLRSFSLDSYTAAVAASNGTATQTHSTLKFYPDGEPTYETVRNDVLAFLEHKTDPMSTTTTNPAKTETPKAEPPAPK